MTDRVFPSLSEAWTLGYYRNRWFVMRAKSGRSKPGQGWRAIAFVRTTRAVLKRILREKGAEMAPDARVAVSVSSKPGRGAPALAELVRVAVGAAIPVTLLPKRPRIILRSSSPSGRQPATAWPKVLRAAHRLSPNVPR